LSFFTLYAIGKTRTGAAAAVKELVFLQQEHLLLISATAMVALGFAFIAVDFVSRNSLKILKKLDYKKINAGIIFLVAGLVLVFSGSIGFVAMLPATAVGLYAVTAKIKRSNNMAFLMLPTILIYLGINVI